MTNKSTFSILFVAQKGKLKANGKAPILARVTVNGEMVHLATRIDVDPDRWLGKECRTPGRSAEDKYINEMLDNYRNVIKNKYNELFFRGEAITAMRLKSILTSRSDEAKRLLVHLTCSVKTNSHTEPPVIFCISRQSGKVILTVGSKSKPDGRLLMWWREIMTSNKNWDAQ